MVSSIKVCYNSSQKEQEGRKMAGEQHRHDISDKAWEKIRPYTIGEREPAEAMPVIPDSL